MAKPTNPNKGPKMAKNPADEVKDFEKPVTREEINAYAQRVNDFNACNKVELTATIREMYLSPAEPRPRIDKETNLPKTDPATGEVLYWPQRHIAKLAFEGGEMETEVKEAWGLEVGQKAKFVGSMGIVSKFGENAIAPIFRGIEHAPKL